MQEDFASIEVLPQQEAVRRLRAALPGEALAEDSYRQSKHQGCVRVACQDSQGRRAWGNPLSLDSVG